MRQVAVVALLGSSFCVSASACAVEESSVEAGGTEGDADGASQGDPTDSGASMTTGPGTASASGTDGDSATEGEDPSSGETGDEPEMEELPPPPATGIQIVHTTADQGVRVDIARDGALVPGNQRNVPLLRDRPLVLRAFYEVDPGYAARDIYAVLYVTQTNGTTTEYTNFITTSDKDCSGQDLVDCRYGTLPNSFYWRIPAADVQPGMSYRIELFETKPGHENDVSDKVPVFPTDGGSLVVGVEDSYQKMRVVLVPIDHTIGNECPEPPDVTADFGPDLEGNPRSVADYFAERLLAQNPADEVEIVVHDTMSYSGSLTGAQLLGWLQQLRFQEDAPPEYFYYAVARPCDAGPDFAGVAQIGGPTMGDASYRVGWGVYYNSISTTAETFVHEIGHQQGRYHIACSGQEAGTDPSYPDPDGDLVSWGIDVFGTQLGVHDPSDHDYMTYCQSTWVSEWGYLKVLPWIQEISSWDFMNAADKNAGKQPLLVGNVMADGTSQWYVTQGYLPAAKVSPQATVSFSANGAVLEHTAAAAVTWERSDDLNVIAPLPMDFDAITTVRVQTPERELQIDRSQIQMLASDGLVSP